MSTLERGWKKSTQAFPLILRDFIPKLGVPLTYIYIIGKIKRKHHAWLTTWILIIVQNIPRKI